MKKTKILLTIFTILFISLLPGCLKKDTIIEETPTVIEIPITQENSLETDAWTLEIDSEVGQKFTGRMRLSGWLVFKSRYGSELPEAHFHVADESLKDLPSELTSKIEYKKYLQDFILLSRTEKGEYKIVTDEIINKLRNFDKENPATILVEELMVNMEGSPSLLIVKLMND